MFKSSKSNSSKGTEDRCTFSTVDFDYNRNYWMQKIGEQEFKFIPIGEVKIGFSLSDLEKSDKDGILIISWQQEEWANFAIPILLKQTSNVVFAQAKAAFMTLYQIARKKHDLKDLAAPNVKK